MSYSRAARPSYSLPRAFSFGGSVLARIGGAPGVRVEAVRAMTDGGNATPPLLAGLILSVPWMICLQSRVRVRAA